uniref:Protein ALP1-like n=1 Tax=Tanacetum cinerariifolium TaxID=118510 RepID=A0A6L2MGN1_TANCI|nr:protein ALP1-like [Tanacetum cinerariifolium]
MSSDLFFYNSSDDEDEVNSELAFFTEACSAVYEESKPKVQRTQIERDRYGVHNRLMASYFSEHPWRVGISSLMNSTSAIRQMAYEAVPDALGEYLLMGATTASGKAPNVLFMANNVTYKRGYYFTDGIYLEWSILIKSISNPGANDHKRILYKTKHEAARKDVERAFGVLKKKWKLIKHPARGITRRRPSDIMYACIILQNMTIHDNELTISPKFFLVEQHRDDDLVNQESMKVTQEIINRIAHLSLKADLVKHIWDRENQH